MGWYRLTVEGGTSLPGAGQVAFVENLAVVVRARVAAGTIAARNAKFYKRGNETAWDVLVPPDVVLVGRQYLDELGAARLNDEPSLEGYQPFDT